MAFLLSFIAGAAIFFALKLVFVLVEGRYASPIAYYYRMFGYPEEHPFEYIAVLAAPFALLTALWTITRMRFPRMRAVQIIGIMIVSALISCLLGGLLWELNDMQAGFFPTYDLMIDHFMRGASLGLMLGPVMILFSIPMNIIACGFAYAIADFTQRKYAA